MPGGLDTRRPISQREFGGSVSAFDEIGGSCVFAFKVLGAVLRPAQQRPSSLHTTHYTLHTTHYTLLHTTHYTLHTSHYTLRTTHYTLHTTHYILSRASSSGAKGTSGLYSARPRSRMRCSPPWRQPRGKSRVSVVNSHKNATSKR